MKESVDFKDFWDKMARPVHAHSSEVWYDRYAQEILGFLSGSKSIVDAGCGSGEILLRVAPFFMKVCALDYSQSMLEKAREKLAAGGIFHVDLFCDNITNIGKHCDGPVDAIYSNGVIQYLSQPELDQFVAECKKILQSNGKIILLNIPNINNRILFMLGFYKHEKPVSFFRILKGLPGLWLTILRFKIKHRFQKYDDGIGNWFSIDQMKTVGAQHGFEVQIYGASVVDYYYRFHAVLTIEDKV